jgi:hydroxymethylpyrimidine/phosphomethylpyrimidine kinase
MHTALTIAGSDSGAGAGIQADLKTFAAHGVFGTSAITAVTAQNPQGVIQVAPLPADLVTAQIEAVMSDLGANAAKTGMLANAAIVEAVAAAVQDLDIPLLVVDPVMVASSGDPLLDDDALGVLRAELLRWTFVVTPNLYEAEILSGITIRSESDRREAARKIAGFGASHVIVKGGHFPSDDIVDLLYDGHRFQEYRLTRVPGGQKHGIGCTFSASLAAHLALGHTLEEALPLTQRYVAGAIAGGPDLGHGRRPLDHFWQVRGVPRGRV